MTMSKDSIVALQKSLTDVVVTVKGHAPLKLVIEELTPAIIDTAAAHGLGQKLVDAGAISRNPDTGKPATPSDKYAAIKAVYDRLVSGEWNAPRGEGVGSAGLLFTALCRMHPTMTPEAIREFLDGLSDREYAALPTDPDVAPHYKAVRDERDAKRAAGIDTKSILSKLTK